MRKRWGGAGAALAVLAAGLASAQPAATDAPAAAAAAAPQRLPGYLTPDTAPNAAAVIPPAPQPGDDRYEADRRVFRWVQRLRGTPRWSLAEADNRIAPPDMLRHHACALNVVITPERAPSLVRLLRRSLADAGMVQSAAKDVYQRRRPFLIDQGETCIAQSADLAASWDYPSGHATYAWQAALILAELAPDRATQILIRGRAMGESRAVCGVHNASAIEGGRTTGALIYAAERQNPDFRADMEAARAELERLRRTAPAPDAAACRAEAELIARTPYY